MLALVGERVTAVVGSSSSRANSLRGLGVVVATWRGHSEVAYGNVVGSSIFNVLCIFGAAVAVGPITVPAAMIWFDSVVMIAASVLMLVFVATGRRLSRNEGLVMLACYVGYIALRYKLGLA